MNSRKIKDMNPFHLPKRSISVAVTRLNDDVLLPGVQTWLFPVRYDLLVECQVKAYILPSLLRMYSVQLCTEQLFLGEMNKPA